MNYAEGLSPELNIKKITEEASKIIDTLANN